MIRASKNLSFTSSLNEALEKFRAESKRLHRLGNYYEGRHDILTRTRRGNLPNARLPHGFPKYIAEVSAGFMLSEEPKYRGNCDKQALKNLLEFQEKCSDPALNMSLAVAQSVYGLGLSLCFYTDRLHTVPLDPRSAFMVFDDTAEQKPVFGVLLSKNKMRVYTDEHVYVFDGADSKKIKARKLHGFENLPMVLYPNGTSMQGDFEHVLPLIDAYDLLASDRINDRAQFADAMLVLTGIMGLSEEEGDIAGKLRQERTLTLPDSDAKAEWLIKNANEKDVEVLRKSIADDIHKFSMTPEMEITNAFGSSSGVALQHKLFCLRRRTAIKERFFIKGLKERLPLLCEALKKEGKVAPNPEDIEIYFPERRMGEGLKIN
ncbi:MAG: phage portal protein [Eubacteriales bacterium]|nr:phage portal protein [Eubacteriales bacterium]